MIIVNQDTNAMINFNNIVYIDIEKNSFDKYVVEAYYNSKDEDYVWLGEYTTEGRALKVLAEILSYYKDEGITGAGHYFSDKKVIYNMPKE